MNYKYTRMLDREWRALVRGEDDSGDDSDDDNQCAKKAKIEPSLEKMCDVKPQPTDQAPPVQDPTQVPAQESASTDQPQAPSVAPPTETPPEPEKDQAALEKEARNRARDEELERLSYVEIPESFHPVPEEFQPMLHQLVIVDKITEKLHFQQQILEQIGMVAQQCISEKVQQVPDLCQEGVFSGVSDDYKPFPHTIVHMYKPVAEQNGSMYTAEQPQQEQYQNVTDACAAGPSMSDPCEGTSTSYQYMQPENMQMTFQGMPLAYQESQYQQNMSMMDHQQINQMFQMNQMTHISQTTYMMEPMQASLVQAPTPTLRQLLSPPKKQELPPQQNPPQPQPPKKDSPRELRNRAEKQRRDKLNQSIALLASLVPPVVAMGRKIDKTTIMKLTAHYLRSHQYVFGDSINNGQYFKLESTNALLSLLKGFVLTVTYRGLIVVVSHNIRQLLGYSELDLIGTNVYSIIHEQDHEAFREHMFPRSVLLGKHGELLIPDEPGGADDVALALARERKTFVVRFKKLTHRSEPLKYMMCHVEGSFRKADKACRILNRCCQLVRRARARGENPRSSGNDVVFVGVVRPLADTFMSESVMESFRMEYRTRHSVDGEIIQCEQRIALVTGYMTSEVNGVNAMNFMHRDDVRWVIVALREMYDQHRLFGESCYRLMTKNGEFVYMRSRGRLDVDESSNIVTSFVCTNTVVGEEEGKHFINQMKKRFNILVNNGANSIFTRDENEPHDENSIPVEDPVQLEKVILYLVTNLPSPETSGDDTFGLGYQRISIIPPKKERIVNAIRRIENILHPSIFAEMEAKNSFGSRTEANDGSDEEQTVSSSTSIVPSIVQPSISTLTTELNRQIVVPSDQLMTTPSPQAFGMPQTSFEAFEMMTNRHLSLSPTQVDQDAGTYQEFGCIHDSKFRSQELQDLQNNPTSSYYDHNRLDLIDWASVFSRNELVAPTSSGNMQNMQINENPLDLNSSFGRDLNWDPFNIYTPEENMQINENPLALTSSFGRDLYSDPFKIYTPEENMQINENPLALTSSFGRDLNLDPFNNIDRITPSKSSNSNESVTVVDSRFDSACSKVIDPHFADKLQLQEERDRHASEKRASKGRKRPRDDDDYNRNYNQRRPPHKYFKGKGCGKHSRSQ